MTKDLIIRRASPEDSGKIGVLHRQLVSNTRIDVIPERIAEVSKDQNTAIFVCEWESDVCATALITLCADIMFQFQPFAVVENFVVDSTVRQMGIGTKLLRHIESYCRDRNCSKIMLLSSIHREQAHHFFERSGFIGL
jgi:N-acetylglutamate synthase-like GNAT family acetyltransferase